ncbi:MAG: twin-arginine translocase TatA/TatE family subunit [Desulfobacterales bacterium]|nr:twin-arginine translocase TatA/TatE family subunit [Desulfobacterales bacterium]
MFGIGLPELILIMAVALVVVGPDKLPELAKSLAKGVLELKKAANTLKEQLREDDEDKSAWDEITENNDKLEQAYKGLPPSVLSAEAAEYAELFEQPAVAGKTAEGAEPAATAEGAKPAATAEGAEPAEGTETAGRTVREPESGTPPHAPEDERPAGTGKDSDSA